MIRDNPIRENLSDLLENAGCHSLGGLRLLLLACPVFISGCAKTGDPHPPTVLVARPAVDLTATQYSDQVMLTVSEPVQNTNGTAVAGPVAIEIWRKVEDRTQGTSNAADAAFPTEAVRIQEIKADRLSSFQRDKKLVLRDDLALADRSQIYSKAFRYAVRFLNRKRQSAGWSNQAIVAPVPIPPPPKVPSFELTQDYVRLKWDAPAENMDGSTPARIAGFNIYRSEDQKVFPTGPLNPDPIPGQEFDDRSFGFGKTYYYVVSIVGSREHPYAESLASPALKVVPLDTFPPGSPLNLNGVTAGAAIMLLWMAPPERDVAGYRIYRRDEGEAAPRLLEPEPVKALSYRDDKVLQGKKYGYRVAAIDTHGNEGKAAEVEVEVR
jgi:hypothetical protein